MKRNISLTLIFAGFGLLSACSNNDEPDPVPGNPIEAPEGYSLVWSDEFNGNAIDASTWNYETGDGTDYGLPAG